MCGRPLDKIKSVQVHHITYKNLGAVAVLFGLMWLLLSRSFLQIATSTGKVIRREYREKCSRQRSIDVALLSREFSRFTASPNYMLNCGLGTFLMPLCAIVVLWKGGALFEMLDAMFAETAGRVPLLICVVLCGLTSMNFMTAPSVSLEGKCLWILRVYELFCDCKCVSISVVLPVAARKRCWPFFNAVRIKYYR